MPKRVPSESALIKAAQQARKFAQAPYSNYRVGAALLTADGRVFTGANVESSSYGLSVCAERVALFKALSEGADNFTTMAIATDSHPPASPCGACRQLLWDYARGAKIILVGKNGVAVRTKIAELLPRPFGAEDF
jgi:cytidine deaminase